MSFKMKAEKVKNRMEKESNILPVYSLLCVRIMDIALRNRSQWVAGEYTE